MQEQRNRAQRRQPAPYRIRGSGPAVVHVLANGHRQESAGTSPCSPGPSSWLRTWHPSRDGNGKGKPSSRSVLQWELGNEQQREKEPVGEGR